MTGLEFAAVALIGVLIGRFLPNRRKGPKPVQPVCGCEHHHSFHDGQTGRCGHVERVYLGSGVYGHEDACSCKRYSGPEPVPEFYAPEIAGGQS